VQRGNNRGAIFAEHEDSAFFYACMADAARRHEVAIHAYVFMTNHFHLLVTPRSASSLPKTMQSVGRVYVRYYNAKYSRTGTLWDGRYKAAIVEHERYLLMCMRYIELNPVRAGMVAAPEQYRWSSFRANAAGIRDEMVCEHPLYVGLGSTCEARQSGYRALFGSSLTDADVASIRDATQNAWALGGASFRQRVAAANRRAERLRAGRPWPSRS
jgi:putative transposase